MMSHVPALQASPNQEHISSFDQLLQRLVGSGPRGTDARNAVNLRVQDKNVLLDNPVALKRKEQPSLALGHRLCARMRFSAAISPTDR